MKRFRFRLEKLLKLKERKEKEAGILLGRALSSFVEAKRNLQKVLEEKMTLEEERADLLHRGETRILPFLDALMGGVVGKIFDAENRLKAAEEVLEGARKEWKKARMEHETMKRLKKRARERWEYELLKEEVSWAEEAARTGFVNRRSESPW